MVNNSLIIMAGGASSRMKKSLNSTILDEKTKEIAKTQHKSLIPLGKEGKPLLYHLIKNASKAGYRNIYLITSKGNQAFKVFVDDWQIPSIFGVDVKYAIQKIPAGRIKPLGTADALLQCMNQYFNLKKESFTVCNGDNLYATEVLHDLKKERDQDHATIAYSGSGLGFSLEKLSKFAVMDITDDGLLKNIVEKPGLKEMEAYRDNVGELRISMNIFSFNGIMLYPYLKNCPVNAERGEKELPEAVRRMVAENPNSMLCIPKSEKIPDLTSAKDINDFYL